MNEEALHPYMEGKLDQSTALSTCPRPASNQPDPQNNDEDVYLFTDFAGEKPKNWGGCQHGFARPRIHAQRIEKRRSFSGSKSICRSW